MYRRQFLRTSAGLLATTLVPGMWAIRLPSFDEKHYQFEPYRPDQTLGTVTRVTPDDGYYLHTFYDVCPFSPSQRYLAVTRLPFQTRQPERGDVADVCVIDLQEQSIRTVYATKGWHFQLGANLQWGATDRHLYTNDIIDGQAVCVRIDLETAQAKAFAGPMYDIAPDASAVIGFPLDLINATQKGYGVPLEDPNNPPTLPPGASETQGLWHTDLKTDKKMLLASLGDIAAHIPNRSYFDGGTFYFFHSKYNRQKTRILQVMRCLFPEAITDENPDKRGWNPMLFTFNGEGSDIKQAVTHAQWAAGGNHPNWHPDGEHIIMNLTPVWTGDSSRRFCMFRYDGSEFKILSDSHVGSGHPSVDPQTKYLVTDAYPHEPMALKNEEVPIRLLDLEAGEERHICTMYTLGSGLGVLRVDPHPAWSRDYTKVCFNGAPTEKRQVFIADLSEVL